MLSSGRIQPPHLVHRVYTTEKTIVTGGHFYAWETMHLTELALLADVANAKYITNEDHPSAERVRARMAICLAAGRSGARKRVFTSLATTEPPTAVPIRTVQSFQRLLREPHLYRVPGSNTEPEEDRMELPWREHRADLLFAQTLFALLEKREKVVGSALSKSLPNALDTVPTMLDDAGKKVFDERGREVPGKWDDAGEICEVPALPLLLIGEALRQEYQKRAKANKELQRVPPALMARLEELAIPGITAPVSTASSPLSSLGDGDETHAVAPEPEGEPSKKRRLGSNGSVDSSRNKKRRH